MQEHLEMESDYAAAPDIPADSAVGRVSYTKKLNEQERQEFEAREFWRQAFAHPIGRREIWKLLSKGHAFKRDRFASSQTGFPDPRATWALLGRQDYAEELFYDWQIHHPAGTLLMLQEHDPRFARPKAPKRKKQAMQ